jgi:hypothetical protein
LGEHRPLPNHRWGESGLQSRCWECRSKDYPEIHYQRRGLKSSRRAFIDVLTADPCAYCGGHLKIEVDHIDPSRYPGDNGLANLTAACPECNKTKGDLYLLEFLLGEDLFIAARFQPYSPPPAPQIGFNLIHLASEEAARYKFCLHAV